MNSTLFKYYKPFRPDNKLISSIIEKISNKLNKILGYEIKNYKRCTTGQGLNFKILTNNESKAFLLRIIIYKGYPNIEKLKKIYDILNENDIHFRKICYVDFDPEITPYGFLIQEWIEGTHLETDNQNDSFDWIKDITPILNRIYKISSLEGYSSIKGNRAYSNQVEYCSSLIYEVDHSFGEIFHQKISVYELEDYNIVRKGTIKWIAHQIINLSLSISNLYRPVLVHGDILPGNIIYKHQSVHLIDWDEARFSWWPYDLARTAFYFDRNKTLSHYQQYINPSLNVEDIHLIVKIEHTRQLLRMLILTSLKKMTKKDFKEKVSNIIKQISIIINE